MRNTLIFFAYFLIIQCSSKKELSDNEVIEVPIKIEAGYGPFYSGFRSISWKKHPVDSEWGRTVVGIKGVPKDWNDAVVKQIWFDAHQFAFQNYKQGNLSESFFEELKDSWNIDLEGGEELSIDPIKCFTHIVMTKDSLGNVWYKLDTNNDRDFSDEEEKTPPLIDWNKLDSLSQYSQLLVGETFVNSEIKEINIPILILVSDRGSVLNNFPQYAQSEVFGKPIFISSGFADANFKQASSICIGQPSSGKTRDLVELNEYLPLEGLVFQNLGVDFNRRVLKIKKMPDDTILYSTQIGFIAKPFEAESFLTNQPISLKNYTGKYVLMEFWGTWCGPCVQEIPNLKSAYNKVDKSKVAFLGIAQDSPESLEKFLKEKEIEWDQILANKENNLVDLYGINAFPTSFLLDEKGLIVAKNLKGENLLDTLNYYINN